MTSEVAEILEDINSRFKGMREDQITAVELIGRISDTLERIANELTQIRRQQ
jgi:hypothetical protein